VNKQELIEALNQADIMLRPAAIIVNRKTAENIREEIPDFEKCTRLMTNEWLEDWQAVLIDRKKFNELANKVVDVANALTEVFEDVCKF
jgi:hypothetical protein